MITNNENKIVLICDDNYTTASCVKHMLEKLGYKTDIALCAKEAQDLLKVKKYDLLLLDIILPDKNGLVLLEEIKSDEETKDLPVIILSATEKDYADEKVKQQIVSWMDKSFDLSALEETVKTISSRDDRGVKILHVEDDEDLLNIIAITLETIADIRQANNLTNAAKALEEEVFDVIIFDYKLPEDTCEKIIDNIKFTHNKDAKLVLFSAYEPDKELAAKFDKVMLKTTVSSEEFFNCINDFVVKL